LFVFVSIILHLSVCILLALRKESCCNVVAVRSLL
jgi:hypothetical protein